MCWIRSSLKFWNSFCFKNFYAQKCSFQYTNERIYLASLLFIRIYSLDEFGAKVVRRS